MLQQYKMSFPDTLNFAGPDDQSAFGHARTLCGTHAIEIARLDRIVARIPKSGKRG